MQFNLTLNKPAATHFMAEGKAAGLKIKLAEGGKVMFKVTQSEKGAGVFPLNDRTRGGVGVTISGKFAEAFMQHGKFDRNTHMKLEAGSYGWMVGEALPSGKKPSKIVPTARLWRVMEEGAVAKAESAPAKAPRKAAAKKAGKAKTTAKTTTRRASKATASQAAA